MIPLTAKRRSELRAEAHKLSPVVIIGDKGLTDEVIAEIDRSLKAHELIKVRAAGGERDSRDIWMESICARLQAHPVQQIGKIFVIYRENPKAKQAREAEKPKRKLAPRLRGDDDKRTLGSRLRGNDKNLWSESSAASSCASSRSWAMRSSSRERPERTCPSWPSSNTCTWWNAGRYRRRTRGRCRLTR